MRSNEEFSKLLDEEKSILYDILGDVFFVLHSELCCLHFENILERYNAKDSIEFINFVRDKLVDFIKRCRKYHEGV